MTVELVVELDRSENTLWLPAAAVHGFNLNHYVELKDGVVTREVPVSIGLRNGEQVEIIDGLKEGEQVIAQ